MVCTDSGIQRYICHNWYLRALPSVTLYVGVLLVLVVLHFAYAAFMRRKRRAGSRVATLMGCNIHRYLVAHRLHDIAYARNKIGRILLLVVFTMSMTSFIFYLADVNKVEYTTKHRNTTWKFSTLLKMDLGMNVAFCLHFLLRFVAASSKLWFWLSWQTAVDVATIPTYVIYLLFREYWSGFRFLRAMYILSVPDILQISGVLRANRLIQVARLTLQFLTLWLVAAGFVHMFENHGDPWLGHYNGQNLTYFECVYFLIITSSTVGYGDVVCKTTLGRLFTVGFVFVGLAMFANVIPQFIAIIKIGSPYSGSLRLREGKRHVLVCGNVTTESAVKFVKIFLHPDRHAQDLAVVFLHPSHPDLDFEARLKRMDNVLYFRGSEMDAADLERVDLVKADACIILADQFARNPDEEDSANIMRAIAIKNLNGQTRILIQLLLERNKSHLLNVPSWNVSDAVVCLDEFKLGCMAQSCWAPGFATLLSLLLNVSSSDCDIRTMESSSNNVDYVYLRGVGFEMYSADLSPDFAGMPFTKVAELCFQHLQLVLIGVKTTEAECTVVTLNPGRHYAIRLGDRGIFVTHSAATAKKASFYCDVHKGGSPLSAPCSCRTPSSGKGSKYRKKRTGPSQPSDDNGSLLPLTYTVSVNASDAVIPIEDEHQHQQQEQTVNFPCGHSRPSIKELPHHPFAFTDCEKIRESFDFTGMFFWQPKRPVDDAVLTINGASTRNFKHHVIVCVFGDPDSPRLGLRNFVMPLRSSNRSAHELKTIVFIGDLRYLRREWEQIDTFPSIYIMPGSPMDRTLLRAVNVDLCDMCVILSSKSMDNTRMLIDKHAILCYLNVKTMKFGDFQTDLVKYAIALTSAPLDAAFHSTSSTPTHEVATPTSATLKQMSQAVKIMNNIPIIVDITIPENILILDDDLSHTSRTPLILMHPFTCGRTFAGDVLDSVICAAYFNPDVLTLVRELVTGGCTTEADQIFAEGLGFCEGTDKDLIKRNRNRARIYEFSLSNAIYSHLVGSGRSFEELFLDVLRQFGYVCLAVCRLRSTRRSSSEPHTDEQRMVLVSPPEDFQVRPSDKIICLQPVTF